MTDVELLARRSGAGLRATVAGEVDVEGSLRRLHAARRRRRHRNVALGAVAAVAAGVAAVGAGLALHEDQPPSSPQPAPAPAPHVRCVDGPGVRCLSDRTVEVHQSVRYTLRLDDGFLGEMNSRDDTLSVDVYQSDETARAGVAFTDRVVPMTSSGRPAPGLPAHELATWVAARPFLDAGRVTRTQVDGRPAWRVDVIALEPPSTQAQSCNGFMPRCWAVLGEPRGDETWETGPWQLMAVRYTFVDLPGGHTFAIWSWAYNANWRALEVNARLVGTLRFAGPAG